jgi:hypothetical protein
VADCRKSGSELIRVCGSPYLAAVVLIWPRMVSAVSTLPSSVKVPYRSWKLALLSGNASAFVTTSCILSQVSVCSGNA